MKRSNHGAKIGPAIKPIRSLRSSSKELLASVDASLIDDERHRRPDARLGVEVEAIACDGTKA